MSKTNNVELNTQEKKIKNKKVSYPAVKGYDENGKPIFKKKIKEISILNKRDKAERVIYVFVFIIMCIQALSLVLPAVWMFMTSLRSVENYSNSLLPGQAFTLPDELVWQNYIDAFTVLNTPNATFVQMIFNSVWYTLIKTFLGVMVPAFCGYIMCKYKFWGRELLFSVIILQMILPIYGSGAAYMKLVGDLGYLDTPLYVVIANLGGFGVDFLVYTGFFKGVSNSYAEAAKIEGANAFKIYLKIMLPQAMPVLLTFAITNAIANWNAYGDQILYLSSYPTLASGLLNVQTASLHQNGNVYYAGLIISVIPTVTLFCLFSNKIMNNISLGGLKG